jgi:hypothetical protein
MISFWRYVFEYHDLDSFIAVLNRFSKRKEALPSPPSTRDPEW